MSVLLLGERAGPRRWIAIFVGLAGVVVIVRPGGEALQLAALIPLASALTWASALLITRFMGGRERTQTTLFWSAASGLVLLSLMLPFGASIPDWAVRLPSSAVLVREPRLSEPKRLHAPQAQIAFRSLDGRRAARAAPLGR